MKIGCHCGAKISDSTDYLSNKGHLTPDQDVYGVWDRIDDEVIDQVASGDLPVKDAYMVSRRIISSPTRVEKGSELFIVIGRVQELTDAMFLWQDQ